jgi:RHS repeat-associated protein
MGSRCGDVLLTERGFYDPGIGRFIQEDPHPGATRIPITIHSKFIYALNNPVNL